MSALKLLEIVPEGFHATTRPVTEYFGLLALKKGIETFYGEDVLAEKNFRNAAKE